MMLAETRMSDVKMIVGFEGKTPGFTAARGYEVLVIQDRHFLLVNDDAKLVWVESSAVTPLSITRGTDLVFDLAIHRTRRRLEALAGKPVRISTWEHIGFDADEITDENMYVYHGIVEEFDGETLFLRRRGDDDGRFGILPKAIATLDEED